MGTYAGEVMFEKNSSDNTERIDKGPSVTRLKIKSEEQCATCGNVFDTQTSITDCPGCGEPVTSCNACIRFYEWCGDCANGSSFKENYHVHVKYHEEKGGIRYSDSLYHTGFSTGSLEDFKKFISDQYKGGRITYEECKI